MNKKAWLGIGIVGAIALVVGGKLWVSRSAAKEVDKAIADVSDYVDVDYRKVDVSLLGRGTTLKDVVVTPIASGNAIRVDEMTLYRYEDEDQVPTYLNMAIRGIELDETALGENAEMFSELGYGKEISATVITEYEYEADDRTVELKQLKLGADQVGDMEMTLELGNIALDQSTLNSLPFSLFGAQFEGAKITYEDDSFVKRLFETTAAAEGISVEEVKAEAIAGLESEVANGNTLSPEFIEEMKDFINDPDSFAITFAPEEPVPLSAFITISGPEDLIELLNVQFES
ncbi:hypothetical protein S7335_2216 [Synechococcus sp. PCC 7335]|uniref:hypothetical protein n=1 Tax=Synechococcus sp. (strain ATCC 29403 / PCC 7335) TaxID=91464 RepID=UPI00017ED200|nr:hypothetical protein [Synechococcus sp. PCC 7335]EDX84519.1 hypothetical protein S7335_2216 [Synechococcus sp. PCC 7335]